MATELTNLTADIGVTAHAAAEKSIDHAVLREGPNLTKALQLLFGTGAGKADQIWHDRLTLPFGDYEYFDLAGSLINAFGQIITFANVKVIALLNRSDEVLPGHPVATDAPVSFLPDPSNPFLGPLSSGDWLSVPAGGVMLVTNPTAAGWIVTPATGDLLTIYNESSTEQAIYDLLLIGEEAA